MAREKIRVKAEAEGGESRRHLEDWLGTYLKWTLPRSESPKSLILWAGLFTLSSALRRRVSVPKTVLGNRTIYPNLYIMYVGDPGVVRKTTTAGFAEELMLDHRLINLAPSSTSASKLVDELAKTKDGSMSVLSGEFSDFIGTSKEAMYEILTSLYDGKIKHDISTRGRGYELVKNPCVNLLAATTPAWISKQPIEHLISGGFASRVIFIYESKVRQRRFFYRNIDWSWMNDAERKLRADLLRIASLKGDFTYESVETEEWFESWYRENAEEEGADERTKGYFQRKPTHITKVAMLLSVSRGDSLVITRQDLEASMLLLEEIEEKMPRALSSAGSNLSRDIDAIAEYIRDHDDAVSESQLARRFYRSFSRKQLEDYLQTLCIMGQIEEIHSGNGKGRQTLYRSPRKRRFIDSAGNRVKVDSSES